MQEKKRKQLTLHQNTVIMKNQHRKQATGKNKIKKYFIFVHNAKNSIFSSYSQFFSLILSSILARYLPVSPYCAQT